MIEQVGNLEGIITNNAPIIGNLTKAIEYVEPSTQEKSATPTKQEQVITPDEGVFALSKVTINPIGDEYIIPSGTLNITSNGNYDVKNKEYANVSLTDKWQNVGYASEPQGITDFYNVAKEIYDNWNPSITSMSGKYEYNNTIVAYPLVDTSNVTNMANCFYSCAKLKQIPQLNTSNVTTMYNMFSNCGELNYIPVLDTSNVIIFQNFVKYCKKLTYESINNIMKMCINATSYARTKTLAFLGLDGNYYSASKIQELSNYQEFINAGWTIGF